MTTPRTTDDRQTAEPRYCAHCGTPVTGPYCANCGHAIGADQSTAEIPPAAPADDGNGAPPNRAYVPGEHFGGDAVTGRKNLGLILGGLALVVLAIVAVVIVVATSGGSDASAKTKYQQQVARVFSPVLGANQQVSDELARLHGARATDARAAARRAVGEVTRAQGALDALTVPAGSQELNGSAHQVLDRETAYTNAVAALLARPSRSGTSQLQTLASNLTSALSAAGPAVAGTTQTVDNTDVLVGWATRAAHAGRVHRRTANPAAPGGGAAPSGSSAGGGSPTPSGRDCGNGVHAGPNTTCGFALNVRDAYNQAPGSHATVDVFSPATGQTYTMSCAPSGSGVTCSGGNNASVSF
jgi:hypothetical protein